MAGLAHSFRRSAPFGPRLHLAESLLRAGHPHRAAAHCAGLQRRAVQTGCPVWAVVFGALRAEALLRQGDLAAAEHHAAEALRTAELLGPAHRLRPAAVLAETLTAQGRLSEAARHLRSDGPAPDTGHRARVGHRADVLAHLHAEGRHHLAAGRHRAALAVFLDIGRRLRGHDPGRAPVAWRTGAAEALLALGRTEAAAALLAEQLATAGSTAPRERGTALRLRAATEGPARRTATLARAVTLLRTAGDRLELARAYADLGRALDLRGEADLAAAFHGRARHLTETCAAAPPPPAPAAAPPPPAALHLAPTAPAPAASHLVSPPTPAPAASHLASSGPSPAPTASPPTPSGPHQAPAAPHLAPTAPTPAAPHAAPTAPTPADALPGTVAAAR